MKNMKKGICIILACIFAFMLAGCGKNESSDATMPSLNTSIDADATDYSNDENTGNDNASKKPDRQEMSTPDLADYVQERTVTISIEDEDGNTGTGSGFFIDDEGTIVTSYHVIDAANEINVEISNGGSYPVKEIVDFSDILDIAVLKIDYSGNSYLSFIEEDCRTGEAVYAVGSSLGFLNGTFSDGIISSTSRNVGIIECVQTTASISPGNSGGPLVNTYGEVIGINAFSYTEGNNLNLAVRIEMLEELSMDKNWSLSQFREWYKKEIKRSYRVFDYAAAEYVLSKINTYQHVTGETCFASSLTWDFLGGDFENVVEGYHDNYGLYLYEYDVAEFDQYTEYLNSIGFEFLSSEDYSEGISYFYENEFTGYRMDIFVMDGDEFIIVEPYCNAENK